MSNTLSILGGLTVEQFLSEYWQKKPLLVRNALPEIVGMFEPDDIKALALEEHITARLITQNGKNHDQWNVKNSPLSSKDFKQLPTYWTLLVQAIDHYSMELAELWKKFAFIPQWRRDDIMVSYAPKGGSVGQHFDFYDVFLVQGYGQRRWQLGQFCDENTAFVAYQPLKLLPEMQVNFDEILHAGDLLYVPPRLAHYGVAQNECLTFSFGFRMPNQAQIIDRISDSFADQNMTKTPILDIKRSTSQPIGEIQHAELDDLKQKLLQAIQNHDDFENALMALISEPKYPDHIPELEAINAEEFQDYCQEGFSIAIEPASRLLYRQLTNQTLAFWANGEQCCLHPSSQMIFKQLADGQVMSLNTFNDDDVIQDIIEALNDAVLMLIEPLN
ncbi:MAG: cupin [Acinetobacter sp.]|nr:MAG: cupin [Acinetobacter sp.]